MEGPDGRLDAEVDLYAVLMVAPEATDDELKAAYRRRAPMFHPDKHQDPELKESAQIVFAKIQKAYAILSDPEKRAVYDAYGVQGLQASTELVKYCTTREEIIAECKARERLKKEMIKHAMADANSHMEVAMDITSMTGPDIGQLRGLAIPEMSLRQSVQSAISKSDTMLFGGFLMAEDGRGGGYASSTLRHIFAPDLSGDVEVRVGSSSAVTLRSHKQLSPGCDLTGSLSLDNNGSVDFDTALVRGLGHGTFGLLQFRSKGGGRDMIRTGLLCEYDGTHASAFVQLGLDMHLACNFITNLTDDTKVRVQAKLGLFDTMISYGAEREIQDSDNRLAGSVKCDFSGVTVKIKYTCRSQTYTVPIRIADEVVPEMVLLGTVVPILGYFALKRIVIDPYLRREELREKAEMRRRIRGVIERSRLEAQAAVSLMAQTVARRIAAEEAVNGLVIVQAFYGQLVTGEMFDDDDDDDDEMPLVVDVTVALQCLVESSQLRLPATSKAGLLGFYDPCPYEPKNLRVRYRAMGNMHEVTIKDDQDLVCPKKKHMVRMTQSRS